MLTCSLRRTVFWRLTRRVGGCQLLQRGGWLRAQKSPAHVQSLSLQDGADLHVQLVSVVTAVAPQNTQEPEEHQRLRQVNLEDDVFIVLNVNDVILSRSQQEVTSYLEEQFHQVSEAAGCWPLPRAADDDAEEAADEAQVTAGVRVQLLWIPPHLTWGGETKWRDDVVR